jgi:hypothetical protein
MSYLRSKIVSRPAFVLSWIVVLVGDNLFEMEEYQYVVLCEVLHDIVSFESHDWETHATFVVVLL